MDTLASNKARLLFTGAGERMIENVITLIQGKHTAEECQPSEIDIATNIRKFKPHALIVCLQNEKWDSMRAYDVLCNESDFLNLPVIVLGYEDDCTQFAGRVPVKHIKCLSRPLNCDLFMNTIDEFISIAEKYYLPQLSSNNAFAAEQASNAEMAAVLEMEKAIIHKIEEFSLLHGRKNVLVVDDDVRMLNVIKFYLQDLYDVNVVPSGKLALKFIEKKPTDIILLDYMMPEMDGPEVLRQIREGSICPNVPVVFLTGVSDKEMVLRCLELKPNGYLLKPVSRHTLLEKVTEIALDL